MIKVWTILYPARMMTGADSTKVNFVVLLSGFFDGVYGMYFIQASPIISSNSISFICYSSFHMMVCRAANLAVAKYPSLIY